MDHALTRAAPIRAGLASFAVLRALALPFLRRIDRQITIKHPYTGHPFTLRSYTHKGYWYYGKTREAATMDRLRRLIRPGDTVIDAGGHIGFVAQFMSDLVGPDGQVHVFEPGSENVRFLGLNLADSPNAMHIKAALTAENGRQPFYEENVGGFMNSFDPSYAQCSEQGQWIAKHLQVTRRTVATMRLDDYTLRHKIVPQFLKIDVEGSELDVLKGAMGTVSQIPALMVEVSRNEREVFALLTALGFHLTHPDGRTVACPEEMIGNIFAERT